jgi:hypothetical protein
LDDEDKEYQAKEASLVMFGEFLRITLASVAALAAPIVVMWAADATGLADFDAVSAFLLSWRGIVLVSLLAIPMMIIAGRL